MLQKNEIITLTAEGYTSEGAAVCRAEGYVVFVPGMLRGERARVQLLKVKKTYAYGKITELLEASPHRWEPDCASYPKCGGCQLRHMSYREELDFKRQLVQDALQRIGGLEVTVHPVTPSPLREHYRNKAQLPVRQAKGNPEVGFYAARSHRLIPFDSCLIQDDRTNKAADALLRYMKETGAEAYDETTHKGLIRHLYLRFGSDGRQVMVCVVINGTGLPQPELLCRLMREAVGEGVTVVQNSNRDHTNVVLGKETVSLLGDGCIYDTLCGLEFVISPQAFFQVNHRQTQQLYQKALELADLTGSETVLDLYCGIGTITLLFAQHAKLAYGVEVVPQAVENARENARRNGLSHVLFFCEDAARAAERFEQTKIDVVTLDPPRSGCGAQLIEAVCKISPHRIVYISCNPATLSRDLKDFSQAGYQTKEAFPFDMFPGTAHVETVVLMSRGDK